ncbi:MAG TPA: hypothetical protein VMU88_09430 [bacterium]|nr:hypothetical protein [bacterium]
MALSHADDTRENFLELYRELFSHVSFLETSIERLIHSQRVDRAMLENHLAQMIATIAMGQKKFLKPRTSKRLRKDHPDYFHNQMVKVSKVIKGQLSVLLKTSFLVESREMEEDYLQTLSDATDNIAGAFQHVVRTNVLMPVMLN